MFWKKVNRGLLLGAALLIFLIGFIVAKEVQFRKERSLIEARAQSYLSEICDLQCGVSGSLGKELSESAKKTQREKFDRLLQEHWYGNLPDDEYDGMGVAQIRENYESYLAEKTEVLFSKAELHLQEGDIRVYKDGPDRAVVGLSADVKTEYVGDGNAFFYGFSNYVDYEDDTLPEKEGAAKLYSGVYVLNMTIEMQRVSGEWKIVGVSGYGYESTSSEKGE